jgi:acyl-CoA reductase-like NAD-dependent aldehyde dehydrogenase
VFESRLIIGEDVRPARSRAVYERRDPVTGSVVTRAAAGSAEDAVDAVDAAAAGFAGWSAMPGPARARLLCAAADHLSGRVEEAVAIAQDETGAAPDWTRFNARIAEAMLRQAAGLARSPALDETVVPGPEAGLTYRVGRRPAGVVLAIAPWNAPVTLATRAVAAALACGNTVVLKGSELCPKTHEWVVDCIRSAGLPEGALNFLTNAPEQAAEVVEALIGHAAVRRVNFTGSTRVGREIAVMAARHLKPCLLELSGKGTLVVLEDADLDAAAAAAAHGAFFNQGQVCMSTERVVVVDAVADAFVARLAARARALRAPEGGDSPLGRLVGPGAVMRLIGLIEDAVARGAHLVTGGEHFGAVLQPTVLDHVHAGMRLHAEEAFGPVAAVVRVADEEEALSVANDTAFGLVASVFCRDPARGLAFLRQVDSGIGHVNGSTVYDDPDMPFGGVKASGYGRFGGEDAIHEFTERHCITLRGWSGTEAGAMIPAGQGEETP